MSEPSEAVRSTRVVVEADGASRGNPGPASYGVVVTDADGGEVLARAGTVIGTATNNVAEYRGLIAGLELVAQVAPDAAEVEVRMDSKLVVEQMSGSWRIKHPELRTLAERAQEIAAGLAAEPTYTWIPRAQNGPADALANQALDGKPTDAAVSMQQQTRGWATEGEAPTTLILVRHGVTPLTAGKRFSGGLGGSNPGLSDEGREQIRAIGEWLAPIRERIEAVVTSPVRRTRESAEILAERWGRGLDVEPGFAEMEFGSWDGLSFAEVAESSAAELDAWLGSIDAPAGGGESFREVETRVLEGLERVLERHRGRTVVVVSHVTPIKTLVARALEAPLEAVFRMELTPASVSVVSFYNEEEGPTRGSVRLFNALSPERSGFAAAASRW